MFLLISLYLFVLGAIFGSFILLVVDRGKANKSWVKGRSYCEFCKHKLTAQDLVPILSWAVQKGRCRYCKKHLSVSYPATEFFLGAAFVLSYIVWPYELDSIASIFQLVIWLGALVLMTGLIIYDLRWFMLPNIFVYPLMVLGMFWVFAGFIDQGFSSWDIIQLLAALAVSAGLFLALFALSGGKWIGDGDVRFGVVIGLFTGTMLLAWLSILIASIAGIAYSLPALLQQKGNSKNKDLLKYKLPFGPMLIIGLIITVLFGQTIVDGYMSLLLR